MTTQPLLHSIVRTGMASVGLCVEHTRIACDTTGRRALTSRWRMVDGDVKDVQGSYTFTPADGPTKATCTQAIDIGFWIPGFLRSTFEKKALQDSVEEFRRAVESRGRG